MTRAVLFFSCLLALPASALADRLHEALQDNGAPQLEEVTEPSSPLARPAPLRTYHLEKVVRRVCYRRYCVILEELRQVPDADTDAQDGTPALSREAAARAAAARAAAQPAPVRAAPVRVNPPGTPAVVVTSTCGSRDEDQAFQLLNSYRASLGLSALTCDLVALRTARAHSQDMCSRGYFAHQSPEGTAPWDRLRSAGARFTQAGENIGMGYSTASEVHQGWLASPGHKQNMERATWSRAAVGLVNCGGVGYWTQLFAR